MKKLAHLVPENTVKIKICGVHRPAHFAGAVVINPRSLSAVAAVRNIELVPKSPGRPAEPLFSS